MFHHGSNILFGVAGKRGYFKVYNGVFRSTLGTTVILLANYCKRSGDIEQIDLCQQN